VVGLLSGGPPLRRALRQLAVGAGAAAVTYLLGLAFGVATG
jgi:VIT1/CCC1 family predicted Fe2+/Mn2+ transporter